MQPQSESGAVQGPAWDLSPEYASPADAAVDADLAALSRLLDQIGNLNPLLEGGSAVSAAQEIYRLREQALVLLRDPGVYASACCR
jgi:hypothetical protein